MKDLCIVCDKVVGRLQHAIACDVCDRWQHRKCGNTGIPLAEYREACKNKRELHFTCSPCRIRRDAAEEMEVVVPVPDADADDDVLELSVHSMRREEPDADDVLDEPPVLELSVRPVLAEPDAVDVPDEPPVLELSVRPVPAEPDAVDVPDEPPVLERSVRPVLAEPDADDDQTMAWAYDQETLQDIDMPDAPPAANSTTMVDPTNMSFTFDLPNRTLLESVHPIQEEPIHEELTETVLEDRDVTYTILEGISQKKTKLLLTSSGYSFGVKRENKGSVVWRCTSRSRQMYCHATLKQQGQRFEPSAVEHVHPPTPSLELKRKAYAKVRQVAPEQCYRPAKRIAEDAISEHRGPEDVDLPKKKLLKRVANRQRAKHRPQEPTSLDFEINPDFVELDDFLVADIRVDDHRHIVFATQYQLDLLRRAHRWYIDGTFKIVGQPFKRPGQRGGQLMSIHAFIEKDGETQQMPLVFCLMSRRTKADYVKVLQAVCGRLGETEVEGFVLDFEAAAWQALRHVFPGREIKGCAFHWKQAVWRKVQAVGLGETYRRRIGMHQFIRQLISLQFLPHNHIQPTFNLLQTQATTAQTQQLAEYIQRTWLDSTVFPASSWSVFRQLIRTNNDLEGWHHRLNSAAGGCALQFYRLVPLLRREANIVEMAVRGGDLERNVTGRSKFLQRQLTRLWDGYMENEITSSKLLKRCGELYRAGQHTTALEPEDAADAADPEDADAV